MLYVVGGYIVRGVTYLDNIMYVVCGGSYRISLYNTDTFCPLDVVINVYGMRDAPDMVVCCDDRQLYVADIDCIWRVSVDSHTYVKWLTLESVTDVRSLSLTSRRLLVTSSGWSPGRTSTTRTVSQYNTTDRQLLRVIEMQGYVMDVLHSVETTSGTFIITSEDAVSELFRLCRLVKYCIIS